jgi:hypothetical protein
MTQARQRGNYPPNWLELSGVVKQAACWCCVRCRHPHDVASGHVLTVHHFDGNRENNEFWNLMALCQRCHLSVQARVDPEESLLFKPAPWAIPYIAGFYEAGGGLPGPLYDLDAWKAEYELPTDQNPASDVGRLWPWWAPKSSRYKAIAIPEPIPAPAETAIVPAAMSQLEPNATVGVLDRARVKSNLIEVAMLLLTGARIDCRIVRRETGSERCAARICELRLKHGWDIKSEFGVNRLAEYWMEPDAIEAAKAILVRLWMKKKRKKIANTQETTNRETGVVIIK